MRGLSGTTPEIDASAYPRGVTPPSGGGGRFLSDVIIALGFADRETVEQALDASRAPGKKLGTTLVEMGALSERQLGRAVAERYRLDFLDLSEFDIDPEAVQVIGDAEMRRYEAVPVAFTEDGALVVAMIDPADWLAAEEMAQLTGRRIRRAVAAPSEVLELISQVAEARSGEEVGPYGPGAEVSSSLPARLTLRPVSNPLGGRVVGSRFGAERPAPGAPAAYESPPEAANGAPAGRERGMVADGHARDGEVVEPDVLGADASTGAGGGGVMSLDLERGPQRPDEAAADPAEQAGEAQGAEPEGEAEADGAARMDAATAPPSDEEEPPEPSTEAGEEDPSLAEESGVEPQSAGATLDKTEEPAEPGVEPGGSESESVAALGPDGAQPADEAPSAPSSPEGSAPETARSPDGASPPAPDAAPGPASTGGAPGGDVAADDAQLLREALEQARAELASATSSQHELDRLSAQLATVRGDLGEARAALERTQSELAATRSELASTRSRHDAALERSAETERALSESRAHTGRLEAELAAAHEQSQSLREDLTWARSQIEQQTQRENDALAELRSHIEAMNGLRPVDPPPAPAPAGTAGTGPHAPGNAAPKVEAADAAPAAGNGGAAASDANPSAELAAGEGRPNGRSAPAPADDAGTTKARGLKRLIAAVRRL